MSFFSFALKTESLKCLVRQPCVRLFRRRRRVEADDPRGLGQRRRTSGLPQNDRLYGVTSTWNQSDDHELQRHRLKNNNNTSSLNLKKNTFDWRFWFKILYFITEIVHNTGFQEKHHFLRK
jgi:hypothetical protein